MLDAEAGKGGDGCENGVGIEREKRERGVRGFQDGGY